MSLPVSYLVDDAARKIGDPNKTRVQLADWTLFYNQSTRELCQKADVMQYRATFNLGTQAAYKYPDEMTTMTALEVTETPSDGDSWRFLTEKFEDEWRSEVSSRYPSATLPQHYFADKLGFFLVPRPTAAITGGGRITYFGLTDRIFDTQTADFQLPEFCQDLVVRRMVIHGLMARNRLVQAEGELKVWYADVGDLGDAMEDRARDRRSSIRPRVNRMAGMR
jgi:hypothetical protein